MAKQPENKPHPIDVMLDNGERKEVFVKTWDGHVKERDQIESFTTIVGEQLFHIIPEEGCVMLPFTEYNGDHSMNWVISIDTKTNEETFRKNIRSVDMIHWKLSSSSTKSKANGK